MPGAAAGTTLGENVVASAQSETGLTNEPLYEGEPILAVAAIDELTASEAIEKIVIEFEPLPFTVDPIESLRPGSPNARVQGNVWARPTAPPAGAGRQGAAAGAAAAPAANPPAAGAAPAPAAFAAPLQWRHLRGGASVAVPLQRLWDRASSPVSEGRGRPRPAMSRSAPAVARCIGGRVRRPLPSGSAAPRPEFNREVEENISPRLRRSDSNFQADRRVTV